MPSVTPISACYRLRTVLKCLIKSLLLVFLTITYISFYLFPIIFKSMFIFILSILFSHFVCVTSMSLSVFTNFSFEFDLLPDFYSKEKFFDSLAFLCSSTYKFTTQLIELNANSNFIPAASQRRIINRPCIFIRTTCPCSLKPIFRDGQSAPLSGYH